MYFLTPEKVEAMDLLKFKEGCGTRDHVTFLQDEAYSYMLCENYLLSYIGLTIIQDGEIVDEVFMQSEDDIEGMKQHFGFNWNMLESEQAEILLKYIW
jgi:transcriptional regulator of met regulon